VGLEAAAREEARQTGVACLAATAAGLWHLRCRRDLCSDAESAEVRPVGLEAAARDGVQEARAEDLRGA
jgi:hypothetical protein